MATEPRFDDPPVREVSLSILFEALPGLQTLHTAAIRVQWSDEYPKLSESAPLAPWALPSKAGFDFIATGSNWPVPLIGLTNTTGDRAIQFQNDRFTLSWRFGTEGQGYPGFLDLKAELEDKFRSFSEVVHKAGGKQVLPRRVEITYSNYIPSMPSSQLAIGVLTGWSLAGAPARHADYTGVRLHNCAVEQYPNVAVLIGIDPSSGLGGPGEQSDEASTLLIQTESDVDDGTEYMSALVAGHDALVATFLEITTSEMHKTWGMQ